MSTSSTRNYIDCVETEVIFSHSNLMLPKLSHFTSLPCLQALRVRRRWCTFHLEMIFRDHKLDKHGNNCSFKTRISNYRETGRNTSSPLSEGHTVWKIEEYLLWFSQVEDKVANPAECTNQKMQKIKLDIHKSIAPAPTKFPNAKQEDE